MYTIIMKEKNTDKIKDIIRVMNYDTMKKIATVLNNITNSDISLELQNDDFKSLPSNMLSKDIKEYFPSLTGDYVTICREKYNSICINEYDIRNDDDSISANIKETTKLLEFYAKSSLLSNNDNSFQLIYRKDAIFDDGERPTIKENNITGYGYVYTETDDGPALFANGLQRLPELDYLAKYNKNYIAHNFNSWTHGGNEYTLSNDMECMIDAVRHYGETYVYLVIDGEVYKPINPVFLNCKNAPAIGEYHE